MKTIWKYEIYPGINEIEIPKGAKILTVQKQNDDICIWAVVDSDMEKEKRKFVAYGTGHEMNSDKVKYTGTFQLNNGLLVFHLFEVIS